MKDGQIKIGCLFKADTKTFSDTRFATDTQCRAGLGCEARMVLRFGLSLKKIRQSAAENRARIELLLQVLQAVVSISILL
jgi:hypothetical protein